MSVRGRVFHLFVGALLVAGYYAGLPPRVWEAPPEFRVPAPASAWPEPGDSWSLGAASDAITPLVHAGSLVEQADGRVRAFWFAGHREGGPEVGIHTAVLDPALGTWSAEKRILDRYQVAEHFGTHIRKLGNGVAVRDPDGRLRLFVVAVSFGGWAAGRLVVAESLDNGESWQLTDQLSLSPFLNISYLVKGNPVRFADGTLGLPVYHEFIGKFGELLRIDSENRVVERQRIGHGRKAIQPVVLIRTPLEAAALLRNETRETPGFLFRSDTENRGSDWSDVYNSGVVAASAAVGGQVLRPPDHWLTALNHNAFERDDLTLLDTRDGGQTWRTIATLFDRQSLRGEPLTQARFGDMIREELGRFGIENPDPLVPMVIRNKCRDVGCEFQYDYPFMLRTRSGDVHLVFTWNKTLIGHAWWRAPGEQREVQP